MKVFKAGVIAVGVLLAFAGAGVQAQAQSSIGWVDVESVFNKCAAREAGDAQLTQTGNALRQRLAVLQDSARLPTSVWTELRTLLEKATPTEADKTRQAAIQNQARALDDELKTLQQTPSPTEEQNRRINDLSGNVAANSGNLQDVAGDYDRQIEELSAKLRDGIVASIQAAAAQVMKQKNVGIVLNKSVNMGEAASQMIVVAGGIDLTDDVLKQVNSAKK